MKCFRWFFVIVSFLGVSHFVCAATPVTTSKVITQDVQQSMTPKQALQRLKDGNQRFLNSTMKQRDWTVKIQKTATRQYPFAVILSCMDSRTPPEIVFDQGLGDVFAPRIAGNVINDDILGSMEFATKLSGTKLIVVMGHTNCGAIRGACQGAKLGNLTGLLHKIKPAVSEAAKIQGSKNCENADFINLAAKENVLLEIKQIQARSPVIKKMLDAGEIGIVGAMQDLATGKITFVTELVEAPAKTAAR